MRKNVLFFILILMFVLSSFLVQADETKLTGRDIMLKVYGRPDGDELTCTLQMILVNRRNQDKSRTVLSYSKDYNKDKKRLMYFQEPADVRGIGFLSWEYNDPAKDDDRWLYLPALRRVRRISGSSKNDYFMGTDFTYDDLGEPSVDEDTHKFIKEEEIDGQKCWVVESIPKDEDSRYSKKILWIRQDALLAVKVEYYDRDGNLMKRLTVQDLRKKDGIWTTFEMEMDNIQKKHKTKLIFSDVRYNQGIKDSLFRVSTLERGRIK